MCFRLQYQEKLLLDLDIEGGVVKKVVVATKKYHQYYVIVDEINCFPFVFARINLL